MPGALEGTTVISLRASRGAAPLATSRLADVGRAVIKLERPEGDFARGYDDYVHGLSSYFIWNNRGKQSCTVDRSSRILRWSNSHPPPPCFATADVFRPEPRTWRNRQVGHRQRRPQARVSPG
ncbi:CoA transferase [Mesorhizobium newzealandense]|uniref:CoA transferase n=1 Tax=Mesorhizobium newzealandense TaxID=1300302 RepID=A0ABW4UA87_9HYPH